MSEFIIDDRLPEDPSGIAKARVGATKGKDLTALKIGVIAVIVLGGVWFAYSLRGASFETKPGANGQTVSVASQKWSVVIPNAWTTERGSSKTELVFYPSAAGDVRAAIRNGSWIRIAWGERDTAPDSALRQFRDLLSKEKASSASESEVLLGALPATRLENPSGRITIFVRHDPPLLVTTAKSTPDFEAIIASLKGL